MSIIKEFKGEYSWLSNFTNCKINYQGKEYPSVEHAYMSAKCDAEEWKTICQDASIHASIIKKESRNIPLVSNWENIKLEVMYECLKEKYSQEPFKTKLLKTGEATIIEGNWWGDMYWGVCLKTQAGENKLGLLIMLIRNQLRES